MSLPQPHCSGPFDPSSAICPGDWFPPHLARAAAFPSSPSPIWQHVSAVSRGSWPGCSTPLCETKPLFRQNFLYPTLYSMALDEVSWDPDLCSGQCVLEGPVGPPSPGRLGSPPGRQRGRGAPEHVSVCVCVWARRHIVLQDEGYGYQQGGVGYL